MNDIQLPAAVPDNEEKGNHNYELLDFLYSDHERVASILSQLLGVGLPTLKETVSAKKSDHKVGGKINLGIGTVSGEKDKQANQELRDQYDPLWVNSIRLIREFIENESLRPVDKFCVGELRLVCGKILCVDHSLVKSFLSSSSMDSFIEKGLKLDTDSGATKDQQRNDRRKEATLIREYLSKLPLSQVFLLLTPTSVFWFNVKPEFLSLHPLDIPMKFPVHISGDWNVLGLIDAVAEDHSDVANTLNENHSGAIPEFMLQILPLTTATISLFGRPWKANGISPLCIYRQIAT